MEEFTRDTVYKDPQKNIKKFKFDQKVVNAFPDMIYRSVPGYRTILIIVALSHPNISKRTLIVMILDVLWAHQHYQ